MRYQFVDCRWALDDPSLGRSQYLAGHIPGASFLDVEQDLSDPTRAGEGRHPLPTAEKFAAVAGRAGIDGDTFVVAYGSMAGAERLWWLLRHFGHDSCGVIDLDAWRGPRVAGEEAVEPKRFIPAGRSDDTISRDELAGSLDQHVIVDARLPLRYRGEPNPVDRNPGRIPGALNAPWNEPLPELPVGDIVAYCGSGITGCAVLHKLHLTGRNGRLYPGSWSDWEQTDLPRAAG